MSFVKDRHSEDGKILAAPQIRRAGRINLGRMKEGGGAEALPYFVFVPYDKEMLAEAILSQVREALTQYAPGQDVNEPTILPVFLPADSLDLIASSQYKLAGKEGITRCAGDGEYIQFRLGAKNLMEISHGEVVINSLTIDQSTFNRGESVYCPGQSFDGRWQHCEKCRLQFTVDLQIAGLPYFWSLTTGDQKFYSQFFTVLEFMRQHVEAGNAQFITDIPLLLRREEGKIARPQKGAEGTELRFQDMPLLSIEIHPVWLMQVKAKQSRSIAGTQDVPQIESPATKSLPPAKTKWYERADATLPARPWGEREVFAYITYTMNECGKEADDFDEVASEKRVTMVRNSILSTLMDDMPPDECERAIDVILWHLLGWEGTLTIAQVAALWYWGNRPGPDGGSVSSPYFKDEVKEVLVAASKMAELANHDQDVPEPPAEEIMARMGARKVEF